MKRYLPGRVEILLFATLAIICAMIASSSVARDTAMSLLAFPIFIFAAVMGLWRSGRLRAPEQQHRRVAVAPVDVREDQVA